MINLTTKRKFIYATFELIVIFIIIFSFSSSILADNTVSNTVSNEVRPLTLQEQQNQVQEQLTNAQNQLTYVENELTEKVVLIQRTQDKIDKYQADLDQVNREYNTLQNQVVQAEQQLNAIQDKYNKKEELMKKRLISMYKRGTTNYLDVLLESKDVIDLIANYFIVETMLEYDTQTLKEIAETKQQMQRIANDLQEKKVKMKLTKAEAEKQTVILTNTKTILENEKASLNDTEVSLVAAIDSYKKQQEEINNLIAYSIQNSTYELQYTGGVMIWPTYTTSYITSPFGNRMHPIQGIVKGHDGIDIGADMGDPIYAAADGIIIYYGWMSGYGNTVMIDHGISNEGNKVVTLYGHGSEYIDGLSVGSFVKTGTVVMKVGSTGNSTGPHVHFEVRENGVATDPKKYLSASQ